MAIRKAITRLECRFTTTGKTGRQLVNRGYKLATVTIHPLVGEPLELDA